MVGNANRFRIWDIRRERYLNAEDYYIGCDGVNILIGEDSVDANDANFVIESCVGLVDKRGEFIWAGDKVRLQNGKVGFVNYRDGQWYVGTADRSSECHYPLTKNRALNSEVIGTIHEGSN